MHKHERERRIGKGTGGVGKEVVMGLLERSRKDRKEKSQVIAIHVEDQKTDTLDAKVRQNVRKGSEVFTDALSAYRELAPNFFHEFVDYAERYVDGQVHTNGMENFWSLLKRGIKGTYVSVEPFHLFRYLDEQVFRFNKRGTDDAARFRMALAGTSGRHLTYRELTGRHDALT